MGGKQIFTRKSRNLSCVISLYTDGNETFHFSQAVKEGIFKNDNIMIHVGQNLFNFVFTTLAWFTVSQIYSLTAAVNPASTPREMRSISLEQAAEEVLDAITAFENKQKTE